MENVFPEQIGSAIEIAFFHSAQDLTMFIGGTMQSLAAASPPCIPFDVQMNPLDCIDNGS